MYARSGKSLKTKEIRIKVKTHKDYGTAILVAAVIGSLAGFMYWHGMQTDKLVEKNTAPLQQFGALQHQNFILQGN